MTSHRMFARGQSAYRMRYDKHRGERRYAKEFARLTRSSRAACIGRRRLFHHRPDMHVFSMCSKAHWTASDAI